MGSRVTGVVSETPNVRATRIRGVPHSKRTRVVVYALECGHETSREIGRLDHATEHGRRMRCQECLTAAKVADA